MSQLFSLGFWFSVSPPPMLFFFLNLFAGLFGVFLILTIILSSVAKRTKKHDKLLATWFSRCASASWLLTWTGLLWLFFTWQRVGFFGSRFWILVWGVGLVIYLYFLWKDLFIVIPKKRKHWEETQAFKQYLPKRKK